MPRPSVKGKLLQAGLATLHAHGFNGCSIQDITEAAGVPKGSFFNHFKNKEALAIEAHDLYCKNFHIEMLFDESKRPLDRLRDHFVFLADCYEKWGFERGCLLGNLRAEMTTSHPQMRRALQESCQAWTDAVALVLRAAQSEGAIDSRLDADRVARYLVNAWEGLATQLKVHQTRALVDEFLDVTFRFLLK
jgi:TetR/AcrR family transcriptional regulator, transcriptional repressor for nem operon